jgi:hypothetical protein
MIVAAFVIPAAFGAHLAATLFTQLPGNGFGRVREFDLFAVVPSWRFFAPRPATTDYHLFCRGLSEDGTTSSWEDVHPPVNRSAMHAVWFPSHRTQKALFDVMTDLLSVFRSVDGSSVNDQPSYKVLERYVLQVAVRHRVLRLHDAVQFCIATSAGYDESVEPSVLFVSRRIGRTDASVKRCRAETADV